MITDLRRQEAELNRRVAELSTLYGDRHPTMINARAELRDIQRSLAGERQRLVAGRPDSQLRAYYEEHVERFRSNLELDVGMILISAGERPGRRAALARATELHERIRAGESFEALAREQSEHRSREQ